MKSTRREFLTRFAALGGGLALTRRVSAPGRPRSQLADGPGAEPLAVNRKPYEGPKMTLYYGADPVILMNGSGSKTTMRVQASDLYGDGELYDIEPPDTRPRW